MGRGESPEMNNVVEADAVVVAEGEISFVKTQGVVARDLDAADSTGVRG